MPIENALVTSNPVSIARSFAGYSLDRLGKRLGVSRQYLSRAEHGTYTSLNKSLCRWTSTTLGISVHEVERRYEAFQKEKRRTTALNMNVPLLSRKGSKAPGHEIFQNWRAGYWPTVMSFCKAMCVHPASVENYEDGATLQMPMQLAQALREGKMLDPNWSDAIVPNIDAPKRKSWREAAK